MIYTSGSAGQPKGTLVSHYNVVRLFEATRQLFNFGPDDVWTLFHSCAFDFSVWEIFGSLLHGGKLVIVSYWMSRSPDEYYRLLSEQRVTVLNQTPSAFGQLIRAEDQRGEPLPLSLKWVILGGEALDVKDLGGWFARHGHERPAVINMYGITETTVHVTHRRITANDVEEGRSVIGPAMQDMWIYILDPQGRPVPVGARGEIHVGGGGVAIGYLNRPELNERRFVADRFSQEPGARMYRSGDLARFLPNGDIEYLGRIDDQVKIRGFRVALGEVKAYLTRHPAVKDVVVVAQDGPNGSGVQMLAYVIPAADPASSSELREYLRRSLPDYMLPAHFINVAAFPLTSNGKVDKRALPLPLASFAAPAADLAAPSNDVEAALAEIWKEELGLERVGVNENFFDLGGHSLLMARVQRRISGSFGRSLSMAQLFQASTIRALAAALGAAANSPAEPRAEARGAARIMAAATRAQQREQQREARELSREARG